MADEPAVAKEVSKIKSHDILKYVEKYPCIAKFDPVVPKSHERANTPPKGKVAVYTKWFDLSNFRLPATRFSLDVARFYGKAFAQYHPFGLQKVLIYEMFCWASGKRPDLEVFRYHFRASRQRSWFTFDKRTSSSFTGMHAGSVKDWRNRFFFVDDSFIPEGYAMLHIWNEEGIPSGKNTMPLAQRLDRVLFERCNTHTVHMRPYVQEGILVAGNISQTWGDENRVPNLKKGGKGRGITYTYICLMMCCPIANNCLVFYAEMNLSQLLCDDSFTDWTVGTKRVVPEAGRQDSNPSGSVGEPVVNTAEVEAELGASEALKKKKTVIRLRKRETPRDRAERDTSTFLDDAGGQEGENVSLDIEPLTSVPPTIPLDEEEEEESEGDTIALRSKKRKRVMGEHSPEHTPSPPPFQGFFEAQRSSPPPGSSSGNPAIFTPGWKVGENCMGRDHAEVTDFLANVRPPGMARALSGVSAADVPHHAYKAFFDNLMWQVEYIRRLELAEERAQDQQRISSNLDHLLKASEAEVERLKRDLVAKQGSLTTAEQEIHRLSQELAQKDEKNASLELKLQGFSARVRSAEEEVVAFQSVAEKALEEKKKLQAGLPAIGAKMLQCPGIFNPFLAYARGLKELGAHQTASLARRVISEDTLPVLPAELQERIKPELPDQVKALSEALEAAQSPYVNSIASNLDMSVEDILALNPV